MKNALIAVLAIITASGAQTVVLTLDAPDTNISGLAYGAGSLWAVDGLTRTVYQMDPTSGSVQSSWWIEALPTVSATGLGFGNNMVHVGLFNGSTFGDIWQYTTAGVLSNTFTCFC